MELIDTNILYYKYKSSNYRIDILNKNICSINALEFLKNIDKQHPNAANYYIPSINSSNVHFRIFLSKMHKNKAFNKRLSDFITFNFNNRFPTYNLYNNYSIQQVINGGQNDLIKTSIDFLPKKDVKDIYSKFNFLVKNRLNCISIENSDIALAFELLDLFLLKHSLKKDFRNCWNDLLIGAVAINRNANLISEDKLLNEFIAGEFGIKKGRVIENIYEYSFQSNVVSEKKFEKFESKGYINNGWNYLMKNK